MKALLVGTGGIGRNVYLPQLQNQGFSVTTADLYDTSADFQNPNDAKGNFDIGEGIQIDQTTSTIRGRDFNRAVQANVTPLILALR